MTINHPDWVEAFVAQDMLHVKVAGKYRSLPGRWWRVLDKPFGDPLATDPPFESRDGCTFPAADYFTYQPKRLFGRRGWLHPPPVVAHLWPACVIHDATYGGHSHPKGGDARVRALADAALRRNTYKLMRLAGTPESGQIPVSVCWREAWARWKAVRVAGVDHFLWAAGTEPRTPRELWTERWWEGLIA